MNYNNQNKNIKKVKSELKNLENNLIDKIIDVNNYLKSKQNEPIITKF